MKKKLNICLNYTAIIFLAIIMAFVYAIFVFQNSFAPAGINGIATMVQYLFNFSVGYMSLIINIPLAVIVFFKVNKSYAVRSLTFVVVFSVALLILKKVDLGNFVYHTENGTSTILAPVTAGGINGAIYGLLLKLNACTGGTDFITMLIKVKKPYMNFAWLLFSLNASVAVLSYFVYGYNIEPVILCIVYCFATSKICDLIVKGAKRQIKFEVVTTSADEISAELLTKIKHGVTVLNGKGMYSKSDKNILMCVVNRNQIVDFQNIIKKYPNTFAYITDVTETVGNFKKVK